MDRSRRIRGMVGIAFTWGVGLATLATGALAVGVAAGLVPSAIYGAGEFVAVAARGLLVGGVAGGVFAWLLSRRERGHSLSTLSTRRVAVWGFVAGSLPMLLAKTAAGSVLPISVVVAGAIGFGGIGSLLSATTLGIARRAPARLAGADEELARLRP